MIEKWEQRAIHMNFKKAVIIFLVTCFVLMISVPAALYGNFQNRIPAWEQTREADREHKEGKESYKENKRHSRENEESDFDDREQRDLEDIYKNFPLSWGALALLTGCAVIGAGMGIWYWILVMAWAYRKAYRMGVNSRLAVLAALFFNLAAVAALSFYGILKGSCANCGRVRRGKGKFCDRCGSLLKKECPRCGQEADVSSAYCSNCGKKLDEK